MTSSESTATAAKEPGAAGSRGAGSAGASQPATLSAFDCLLRGVHSLRGNWQLVPLYWAQQVLMLVLLAAAALAFVVPLGLEAVSLDALESLAAEDVEMLLLDLLARPATLLGPLLIGLLASTAVGLVACLVYCWFQGGLVAVLWAGDRQAPAGAPRDWRLFRAFGWRPFSGWARRLLWRYFWLVNLYLTGVLLVVLVWLLVVPLSVWVGERLGGPAAAAMGCGASVPFLLVLLASALWYLVAQTDLAREGSGVAHASRFALRLLRRRPGALVLLTAMLIAASFVLGAGVSAGFAPLSMFLLPSLLEESFAPYCLGQVALYTVQVAVSGALGIAYVASIVALVGSEMEAAGEALEGDRQLPSAAGGEEGAVPEGRT